ncbi:hypothetical protein [Leptolyngbya ohadii]|uniref:hypothetical protein n=1 Tax=Leptolyngbya ohadii TaxID=1962290 RepID=UPI000B59B1B9|nr:hypothetical protein [Leptolyngbya ohadii]
MQFLLTLIAEGKPEDAKEAIDAMGIHVQDSVLWQRVGQAVEGRKDAALKRLLEQMSKSLLR